MSSSKYLLYKLSQNEHYSHPIRNATMLSLIILKGKRPLMHDSKMLTADTDINVGMTEVERERPCLGGDGCL